MPPIISRLLTLLALSGIVLSWRLAWGTRAQATAFHQYLGYWWMWGLFLYIIYTTLQVIGPRNRLKGEIWSELKLHRAGAILIILCSVFLHVHEPHVLKVLYDEPSHLHVSQMMHFERQAMLASRTHFIGDHFIFLNSTPPFRQYFFSFLLCLEHDLTGYSPFAPFILNGILGVVLLGATYSAGYMIAGKKAGIFAVLSLTALPLLAQNVTSGGYDILNLCCVALLLIAGIRFIQAPIGTASKWLNLLVALAWAASQVRYESLLYFATVCGLILVRRILSNEWIITWPFCLVPLALAPSFTANMVMMKTDAMMLSFLRTQGESFIGIEHIAGNFQDLLVYLYNYDRIGTGSVFVAVIGTIGCLGLYVRCAGQRRVTSGAPVALWVLAILICNVGLAYVPALLHFWSSPLDGLAARFTLPIWLCLSLGGGWLVATEITPWPNVQFLINGAAAFVLIVGGVGSSATHSVTDFMVPSRVEHWFIDFAAKQERQSTLFASKSNLSLIVNGYAAVGLENINKNPDKCVKLLQSGIYKNIYLVERSDFPATREIPIRKDVLLISPNIVVEEVLSRSFSPGTIARIVKFIGYKNSDGQLVTPASAPPLPDIFETDLKRSNYLFSLYP